MTCCRRALSERVATYNQRVVGEGDSLAEEVHSYLMTFYILVAEIDKPVTS